MMKTVEQPEDINQQIAVRRQKLVELSQQGNPYPNDFHRSHLAADIHTDYDTVDKDTLAANSITVTLAGRIMTRRIMGKASFIHIQDMSSRLQIYIARDELPAGVYAEFKKWDIGDIVGIEGQLFRTKTDELTVRASTIRLLTKALRPLPDKWHGLHDQEACYRRRYLDLMVNPETRKRFQLRTLIVQAIRAFLIERNFIEVETPMMQTIAGGAIARPFITHHNTLDMELYLRVACELYLKRLVVGGFERVFEINRNFRNEGLSTRHNPEFTMLEWYQAYADVDDGMMMTEKLIKTVAQAVNFNDDTIDIMQPFVCMTVIESILRYNQAMSREDLASLAMAQQHAQGLGIEVKEGWGLGKVQIEIFEKTVEHRLIQPTFITEYPAEVSPLARRNDKNPFITDRFELFISGREIANGFSELNDPQDQAERFRVQMVAKAEGDSEAMPYDEDYIMALEYGMPPTCGVGIGIDRLVMLLTHADSIRDVILFPHMRPVK